VGDPAPAASVCRRVPLHCRELPAVRIAGACSHTLLLRTCVAVRPAAIRRHRAYQHANYLISVTEAATNVLRDRELISIALFET